MKKCGRRWRNWRWSRCLLENRSFHATQTALALYAPTGGVSDAAVVVPSLRRLSSMNTAGHGIEHPAGPAAEASPCRRLAGSGHSRRIGNPQEFGQAAGVERLHPTCLMFAGDACLEPSALVRLVSNPLGFLGAAFIFLVAALREPATVYDFS